MIVMPLDIQTSIWTVFVSPLITIQFEDPLQRHLSHIATIFRWFYMSNWSPFFIALCKIATGGLQSIGDDISNKCGSLRQVSVLVLVKRWKQQITLVRRYVDQLNVSFGLILLASVPYAFVGFTTHIFYLYSGYHRGVPWEHSVLASAFAFKFLSEFCSICLAAESVRKQVRR